VPSDLVEQRGDVVVDVCRAGLDQSVGVEQQRAAGRHAAARLVSVGVNMATGGTEVTALNENDILLRLGLERVKAALSGPSLDLSPADERDASWRSRRLLAEHGLRTRLREQAAASRNLPDLPKHKMPALDKHRPALLTAAPEGDEPSLRIQVTAVIPHSVTDLTMQGSVAKGLTGAALAHLAFSAVDATSPLTGWLRAAAPRFHSAVAGWIIGKSDGRTRVLLTASLLSQEAAASGWRQQTPVLAGAELFAGRTGDGFVDDAEVVMLTTTVGFWLVELDEQRRPATSRAQTVPLPASLTLAEAYELRASGRGDPQRSRGSATARNANSRSTGTGSTSTPHNWGWSTARSIREDANTDTAPVLVITKA
jgi:hypothetical protein